MVRLMLLGSSTTAHYVEPSLELQVESGKNWKGNHKRKSLQEDQHVKQGDRTKHMCAPSCPTLCDPMDCSPLGSSVQGTLQARTLEWVAISFSILDILVIKNTLKLISPVSFRASQVAQW